MFSGHQRSFTPKTDADATSQRRMDDRLELRRQKREENFQKRRKNESQIENEKLKESFEEKLDNLDAQTQERLKNLDTMAQFLRGGTLIEKENTVELIRKLLSIEKTPPIQSVINAGIVQDLMGILNDTTNSAKMRFEAAWALTNVASGSSQHTRVVVDHGGVEIFVNILAHEDGDIKEQAIWALGNIAGDCAELRDRVLRADALNYLLQVFIDSSNNLGLLRNATWTLSNFCRGKPHADFEILRPCLQLLINLLQVEDEEILVDACWAISYISDDPTPQNLRIQEIIGYNFVSYLIKLLSHKSSLVVHPALRAVGNIVTGNDEQTQHVLQQGVLIPLKSLLQNERVGIRKEACWTISNITAGNVDQIEMVVRAGLMSIILKHLESSTFEIRKEACWAVSNATAGGNSTQIKYLVHQGCIKPLIKIVEFCNPKTIRVALEGIENILKSGQDGVKTGSKNPFVLAVEEANGFEIISRHQDGMNNQIIDKVHRIMMYSPQYQQNSNSNDITIVD